MANGRNSNFPLLASDQADVIRIFLDLMIQRNGTGADLSDTSNSPVEPHSIYGGPLFASDLPDFE